MINLSCFNCFFLSINFVIQAINTVPCTFFRKRNKIRFITLPEKLINKRWLFDVFLSRSTTYTGSTFTAFEYGTAFQGNQTQDENLVHWKNYLIWEKVLMLNKQKSHLEKLRTLSIIIKCNIWLANKVHYLISGQKYHKN